MLRPSSAAEKGTQLLAFTIRKNTISISPQGFVILPIDDSNRELWILNSTEGEAELADVGNQDGCTCCI